MHQPRPGNAAASDSTLTGFIASFVCSLLRPVRARGSSITRTGPPTQVRAPSQRRALQLSWPSVRPRPVSRRLSHSIRPSPACGPRHGRRGHQEGPQHRRSICSMYALAGDWILLLPQPPATPEAGDKKAPPKKKDDPAAAPAEPPRRVRHGKGACTFSGQGAAAQAPAPQLFRT